MEEIESDGLVKRFGVRRYFRVLPVDIALGGKDPVVRLLQRCELVFDVVFEPRVGGLQDEQIGDAG